MKSESLKLNKDFKRVYGRGKAYVHPVLVTYVTKNRLCYPRIGITAGKKLGNAVTRNRAKRVILAAWYGCRHRVCTGVDIVFVARSATARVKSTKVSQVLLSQLSAAGLLNGTQE